jgi:hypothetical protein
VTEEGIVNIYCDDPSWIDWFNASGCYIDQIEFNGTTNLVYLDLSHNELKSLDLSALTNIQMLYITDNPFTDSPLVIGPKPNLGILEMNYIGGLSDSFDLRDYPNLYSLDAWATQGLTKLDPTNCPELRKLSIDGTDVAELDVTQNPELQILNITDTRITSIDVTHNPKLYQLYVTHESSVNEGYKLKSLDVSQNPLLYYLFCTGNDLTELDVTHNPNLGSLTARKNLLTSIDVSQNPELFCLNISGNLFGFSNLPWPYAEDGSDMWGEYDYSQRNLATAKSYPVGATIDFSNMVLRDHSDTEGFMYTLLDSDPDNVYLVDETCYTYSNGVVTLKAIPTYQGTPVDSVYMQFTNTVFSAYPLTTGNFAVKSAEDFGKPVTAFTMTTDRTSGTNVAFNVGIAGASLAEPKEFYVDFGDGKTVTFTTTTEGIDQANVSGKGAGSGYIIVSVPDGSEVTGLAVDGIGIYGINLTALRSIRSLSLTNDQLYSIDLSYNRPLEYLNLSHNNLSYISLAGYTQLFGKNMLTDVDLSYNSLSNLEWTENYTIQRLNLSHNNLSALSFSGNTRIQSIDLSYNKFSEFSVADCDALTELNMEGNQLSTITLPDENALTKLNLSHNKFTLATLPAHGNVAEADYIYAPQAPITIATKAPGVDLSEQYLENEATTFTWKDSEGETLTADTDYVCTKGFTWFKTPSVGKKIHCEMTNPTFPAFSGDDVLTTTEVEASEMPNHVAARFITTAAAEAKLTMTAAVDGTSVYIDWAGNGGLTQYVLSTTYTNFDPVTTTPGATVRVYTYDETDNITVLSLRDAPMSKFDGTAMKQLVCLNLAGAGLTSDNLGLPESPDLEELILQSNALTSFDFTTYPKLRYLNLAENAIDNLDVSNTGSLQQLFLGGNNLKSLKFGKNESLWSLYVNENQLTDLDITALPALRQLNADYNSLSDIDFSGNPALNAVLLNHNEFSRINLSPLKKLNVLEINGNNFRFSTLPQVSETFSDISNYSYKYSEQNPIQVQAVNGVVDLSSEASVNGTATTYAWYLGELDYDDYDEITNEQLYGPDNEYGEAPEYLLENGVTTFLSNQTRIICVMTNDEFSDLELTTNMINVTLDSGIKSVNVSDAEPTVSINGGNILIASAEANAAIELFSVNGATVATTRANAAGTAQLSGIAPGAYVLRIGSTARTILLH